MSAFSTHQAPASRFTCPAWSMHGCRIVLPGAWFGGALSSLPILAGAAVPLQPRRGVPFALRAQFRVAVAGRIGARQSHQPLNTQEPNNMAFPTPTNSATLVG